MLLAQMIREPKSVPKMAEQARTSLSNLESCLGRLQKSQKSAYAAKGKQTVVPYIQEFLGHSSRVKDGDDYNDNSEQGNNLKPLCFGVMLSTVYYIFRSQIGLHC
jgi:hypothetical protein